MDLGKMLAEALRDNCASTFNGNPVKWDHNETGHHRINGAVDLNAAAEAFLAKVDADLDRPYRFVRWNEDGKIERSKYGRSWEKAPEVGVHLHADGSLSGDPFALRTMLGATTYKSPESVNTDPAPHRSELE